MTTEKSVRRNVEIIVAETVVHPPFICLAVNNFVLLVINRIIIQHLKLHTNLEAAPGVCSREFELDGDCAATAGCGLNNTLIIAVILIFNGAKHDRIVIGIDIALLYPCFLRGVIAQFG